MKKFIWLASYPKSGNTMLRCFLSAYFFTNDGNIKSFETIKHIINFQSLILKLPNIPSYKEFEKDVSKVAPLWIEAQKHHLKKIDKAIFLKTHNFMGLANNNIFTNDLFTKGFIYIVRDPRSVVISNMHHFEISMKESIKQIFSEYRYSLGRGAPAPEIISSWKSHYLSWKKFRSSVPHILIKYEDIISEPNKEFKKILVFLQTIINFKIDEKKYVNAVNSVNFNNLKKLEDKIGFEEKMGGTNFFRKGLQNEWIEKMPKNSRMEIQKIFYNEMKELGYI
ncbi:MAG: hypothetical protein CFH21_00329 [Alphaproteobacteria bacterium MarineAlpha5_Bin11]|nr:hypothetical protein [Pelagibacteraceae bacterium]PPR44439.1 MAG: hypothetical protein CFH21_00329 [Alphaproteobacteria bacterium MarineAlpha5_Bin11]PPR51877.1 MAG: hypothetical protein CFH20_00296 [Alphaproteobacteria bacterium MarineAlpha5_Bin10]|tara:strand:+ start:80 stop:919 length:840 start_codon:yes stop_codon:yes gene_type:complete